MYLYRYYSYLYYCSQTLQPVLPMMYHFSTPSGLTNVSSRAQHMPMGSYVVTHTSVPYHAEAVPGMHWQQPPTSLDVSYSPFLHASPVSGLPPLFPSNDPGMSSHQLPLQSHDPPSASPHPHQLYAFPDNGTEDISIPHTPSPHVNRFTQWVRSSPVMPQYHVQ